MIEKRIELIYNEYNSAARPNQQLKQTIERERAKLVIDNAASACSQNSAGVKRRGSI